MKLTKRLAILYLALVLVSLLAVPSLAQENITLPATIPAFNQAYSNANGYWGECEMGTNGCPDSIATAGCLITAFSMVLGYYDVNLFIPREASCTATARTGMDPGILNDWLKTHDGYGKCGSDIGSCCLEWTHLPPQVSTTQYVNRSENGIASTAGRVIDESLRQGYPVICGVNWGSYCHGSTTQTEDCHWVVITGKKGETYTIIDPYNRNKDDAAGVRTTLDHGTFGSYTIDRYVVVKGTVPSSRLSSVRLSLSLSRIGLTQATSLTIAGADPNAQMLLYVRVTDPHGNVKYVYYRSAGDVNLSHAREKRSFYPAARSFSNGTFMLYKASTAGEEPGTWTWEVWAEDPQNPGATYGYNITAYTIRSSPAQAARGIAIALVLAIFIASLIYVSILLR